MIRSCTKSAESLSKLLGDNVVTLVGCGCIDNDKIHLLIVMHDLVLVINCLTLLTDQKNLFVSEAIIFHKKNSIN